MHGPHEYPGTEGVGSDKQHAGTSITRMQWQVCTACHHVCMVQGLCGVTMLRQLQKDMNIIMDPTTVMPREPRRSLSGLSKSSQPSDTVRDRPVPHTICSPACGTPLQGLQPPGIEAPPPAEHVCDRASASPDARDVSQDPGVLRHHVMPPHHLQACLKAAGTWPC